MATIGLDVPNRIADDITKGGGRQTVQYLREVKENIDSINKQLISLQTSVTGLKSTSTTTTATTSSSSSGDSTTPSFTPTYESAEQGITNSSTVTLTHGLSSIPKLVQVVLRCKTAELNYAVGDEITMNSFYHDGAAAHNVSIGFNTTSIYIVTSTSVTLLDKNTQAKTAITNANWKYVARAWL